MILAIDIIAILGGMLMTVGVFIEFGLPWALIFSGGFMVAMALIAANKYEKANAVDSD